MLIQDLIAKKRDAKNLTEDEIRWFIQEYSIGNLPDYQAASMLMAIFIRGMNIKELGILTDAMLHSGIIVDLSSVTGIKVDKHSTGGVGDKISIPLAPIVASCGVPVPMVSGRGLGHTGGTLDKLESIPGFNVNLSISKFAKLVSDIGLCMIGQTKELAPADRKIYALRDATATVPSIPLISSSIMSKKLAEGIDALVLDVKTGTGAFMTTHEQARELAETLVGIGKHAGKKVTAFLTRMDDPLGEAIGNSNEMIESIEVLKGQGPKDINILTYELASEMLLLGEKAKTKAEAINMVENSIISGKALEKMEEMIISQGGNPKVLEDYSLFPSFKYQKEIKLNTSGYVVGINSTEIGMAGVLIGAGRKKSEDAVDHGVGIKVLSKTGDYVSKSDAVAIIQYNEDSNLEEAINRIKNAYETGDNKPSDKPLIYEKIS